MTKQKRVEIELTEAQKAQVKAAIGRDADKLELDVEELEERIAPSAYSVKPKLGGPAN